MAASVRLNPGEHAALLRSLADYFDARGVRVWVTGGFLRDLLLERHPYDIDLAVAGDPLSVGPHLAESLGGQFFPLREERGQARILLPERRLQIDLMPLRAADLEGDLRRRDYTIDAMAAELREIAEGNPRLLDPTGGLTDLRSCLVRMTGEQAFEDDPLRLLRGPRIGTELGFALEPGTAETIRRLAATVTNAAPERQRDEIVRVCSTESAGAGLRLLDDLGLFGRVFPEMEVTRSVDQPKEHYYDVLGHSFAAVGALDWLMALERPAGESQAAMWSRLWSELGWLEGLREYFREELTQGSTRLATLKLCGLLHDIAKPETKSFEANGRMRFFGHSERGAEIASALMRRLRFSTREVKMVATMIEAHLRPIQLGQQGAPSRKAVYRFFRDTGDSAIATLFLSLADHLASVGPRVSMDGFQAHVALINYILHEQFTDGRPVLPRLVDGDVLMAELALEPGPLLGKLLAAVREAQAVGDVATQEEAIALARSLLADARAAKAE